MDTQSADSQSQMTPASARAMLEEGHARFLRGERADRDLGRQVSDTAGGQWPYAVILGCIDSRVPAEHVFDLGIGDVFNVRIAGNFVNTDILGSMEFACKVAGAKLIVVLGHTACGAIKGACDNVELGNLTEMLACLKPAVQGAAADRGTEPQGSSDGEFVQAVVEKNVDLTIEAIRERSAVLRELEDAGDIAIVGAVYDVATGKVTFND